jgi:divalent metal cation (Fe/Co/Zn/Cd) transporter
MTKKQFWQGASNWGLICGATLFVVSLAGWAFKSESLLSGGLRELMLLIVFISVILVSGRRNAALTGSEGYPYGRAVGFVFAMMMFAGIVCGVGQFVLTNLIARDYFDAFNASRMDAALAMYQSTPMYEQVLASRDIAVRWMANPIFLIFGSVFELVFKGGFLGLILGAFIKKNPDIFAGAAVDGDAGNVNTPANE